MAHYQTGPWPALNQKASAEKHSHPQKAAQDGKPAEKAGKPAAAEKVQIFFFSFLFNASEIRSKKPHQLTPFPFPSPLAQEGCRSGGNFSFTLGGDKT
jgi:hypothetical protein